VNSSGNPRRTARPDSHSQVITESMSMSKNRKPTREEKKKPALTIKEKRSAKKNKAAGNASSLGDKIARKPG